MEEFEAVIFTLNPYVLMFLAFVSFMLAIYFGRRAKAISFAQWVAKEGQFKPLPEKILNEAIEDAENNDVKDEFLRYLVKVRIVVGHNNVKIGHLYWIWEQMSKNIPVEDHTTIPTFIKDN